MKSFLMVAVVFFTSAVLAEARPDEILRKADAIRNPSESYAMSVEVVSGTSRSVFEIFLKDNDKTLIVTKEPAKDRGRNMLMLDRDFHAYVPNLKRSVRLSLSQKLMGQVANGDISRMRWHGDYLGEVETANDTSIQLLLKANKKNLTYEQIRLWVEAKTYKPLRASYLSLDGKKILKTAEFTDYRNIAGKSRPGKIVIRESDSSTSEIKVLSMAAKDLPDSFFTVRSMESMR